MMHSKQPYTFVEKLLKLVLFRLQFNDNLVASIEGLLQIRHLNVQFNYF